MSDIQSLEAILRCVATLDNINVRETLAVTVKENIDMLKRKHGIVK